MKYVQKYIGLICLFLLALLGSSGFIHAQNATPTDVDPLEIKIKIEERNNQIRQLETEINQYNTEVDKASKQGATLQSTLKTLDLTKKKITTDITLTNRKIDKTSLTIKQTGNEIDKTKSLIDTNKKAIINAIKEAQSQEDIGLLQLLLSSKNISDVWQEIDDVRQVQNMIQDKSRELTVLQKDMENKQSSLLGQKKNLVNLKQDLNGKAQAVVATAQEKVVLLAQTKNKEETFKQLVKTKEELKAQFEDEINAYEAQLNITIDRNAYPSPKHGILSWPLNISPSKLPCDKDRKIISCIVRGFWRPVIKNGKTVDKGHNGVDFRATTGTRIESVLDGVVAGVGNTDVYRGCVGFGKWDMVTHNNGLSSIYMHLSVISVSKGQNLSTGDLVGFSGNTGNSEAPHLHVSVYATQGISIQLFTSSTGCKQAMVPLADPKAYLDPLAYFPSL